MPSSYYFIFTLKQDMITSCRGDGAQWKLIKMGPGAPAEGGSRQLLEWAKSKAAQQAGLGLDQKELERFAKRVVTRATAPTRAPAPAASLSHARAPAASRHRPQPASPLAPAR